MADDPLSFPTGLSVAEARACIVEIAAKCAMPRESVPLEEALGRILTGDVSAPFDVPGFANSAMDGFALRGADLPATGEREFRLVGEIFAGGSTAVEVTAGACVRITTGAPLPQGADTVVMKEHTRSDGDRIHIASGTMHGANVRPAGEDYRAGDRALTSGVRLSAVQVAILAAFGRTHAEVSARAPTILFTTGDELTPPGEALGFGRIHDSNRYSLGGLIEQHCATLLRHERLRDDPAQLRKAFLRAGDEAQVIVSSGGVSAGEADFLPRLIADIGKVYFWKVRIKPGMPFLFGAVGKALVFALPGNPVSGIATFLTLVKPALAAMTGERTAPAALRARLAQPLHKRHARAEFVRARLGCDADGCLTIVPHAKQGSGMLRGVVEANALIVLPEGIREFVSADVVDVLPLPGWP